MARAMLFEIVMVVLATNCYYSEQFADILPRDYSASYTTEKKNVSGIRNCMYPPYTDIHMLSILTFLIHVS